MTSTDTYAQRGIHPAQLGRKATAAQIAAYQLANTERNARIDSMLRGES